MLFRSQEIAIVDNITAMRKVKRVSLARWIGIYLTLALRAVYIAARKSSVPNSKELGRILLRRLTVQTWLPALLLVFSTSIAR